MSIVMSDRIGCYPVRILTALLPAPNHSTRLYERPSARGDLQEENAMNPLLSILKIRHSRLERLLRKEMACPHPDALRIQTLKRKKLAIKDRIVALSQQEVTQ